jgi:hypothetical protein
MYTMMCIHTHYGVALEPKFWTGCLVFMGKLTTEVFRLTGLVPGWADRWTWTLYLLGYTYWLLLLGVGLDPVFLEASLKPRSTGADLTLERILSLNPQVLAGTGSLSLGTNQSFGSMGFGLALGSLGMFLDPRSIQIVLEPQSSSMVYWGGPEPLVCWSWPGPWGHWSLEPACYGGKCGACICKGWPRAWDHSCLGWCSS